MDINNSKTNVGIVVNAKVSLGCGECHDNVQAAIYPDAMTLLPQVQTLTTRVCARARAMMFEHVANRFNTVSKTGIYPEDTPEVMQANVRFFVGNGIVASMQGTEIDFGNPSNIAEMLPFEHEAVEQAEKALVMYLLAAFAYGKEVS